MCTFKNKIFNFIFINFCFNRICKQYDEIQEKVSKTPGSTAELVEITQFLTQCMDATVYKLAFKIDEARQRLMFLLDYASMPSTLLNLKRILNQLKIKKYFSRRYKT